MNAIVTVIPIILIRYGLMGVINRGALKRAASFAPLVGNEIVAYWVYQVSTGLMLLNLFLLEIRTDSDWLYAGLVVYALGVILYAVSVIDYARPERIGMNTGGLYQVSRNPMYVAYFICLLGCVLLTQSWTLLALLIAFQVSTHWIILSEERWCIGEFGEEYAKYMNRVRRYV